MTEDEIDDWMAQRSSSCNHTHVAMLRGVRFSEEKVKRIIAREANLVPDVDLDLWKQTQEFKFQSEKEMSDMIAAADTDLKAWREMWEEYSQNLDPDHAWVVLELKGQRYWTRLTMHPAGLIQYRMGDMVVVSKAPPGGFTAPYKGMVGEVIGVDNSRVPYMVKFTMPNGKTEISPFLEGRLELVEKFQPGLNERFPIKRDR